MTEFLFGLHSGLRYVVLVALAAAMVVTIIGMRGSALAAERKVMAAFTGLVDAQVLVGIILLLQWPFYGQLMGHITMMVLAAVAAHTGSVVAKRREPMRGASGVRFATTVVTLILIVGGILAIERSVL